MGELCLKKCTLPLSVGLTLPPLHREESAGVECPTLACVCPGTVAKRP